MSLRRWSATPDEGIRRFFERVGAVISFTAFYYSTGAQRLRPPDPGRRTQARIFLLPESANLQRRRVGHNPAPA
jgi:hypothetical protein